MAKHPNFCILNWGRIISRHVSNFPTHYFMTCNKLFRDLLPRNTLIMKTTTPENYSRSPQRLSSEFETQNVAVLEISRQRVIYFKISIFSISYLKNLLSTLKQFGRLYSTPHEFKRLSKRQLKQAHNLRLHLATCLVLLR